MAGSKIRKLVVGDILIPLGLSHHKGWLPIIIDSVEPDGAYRVHIINEKSVESLDFNFIINDSYIGTDYKLKINLKKILTEL